jgi:hypothetical protein
MFDGLADIFVKMLAGPQVLDAHSGPLLLSGYAHPIYDERLKHWKRETKAV